MWLCHMAPSYERLATDDSGTDPPPSPPKRNLKKTVALLAAFLTGALFFFQLGRAYSGSNNEKQPESPPVSGNSSDSDMTGKYSVG